MNVPEVEVRLETLRIEEDRPFVERLGLDQLVARIVDVGKVHDRRNEIRIDDQRLAVGGCRLLHLAAVAIVQPRSLREVLGGQRPLRIRSSVSASDASHDAPGPGLIDDAAIAS